MDVLSWYLEWVKANALLSAAIHFGVLGSLGESLSLFIRKKRIHNPFSPVKWIGVILAWALLGVVIKYGFVAMAGALEALVSHQFLPSWFSQGLARAFAVSVITNLFFGPQMMLFHRLEENFLHWRWDFSGLKTAWMTLIWFWIPAHTLTFSLPKDYQIGLAACWSVVLGVIMGMTAPKR